MIRAWHLRALSESKIFSMNRGTERAKDQKRDRRERDRERERNESKKIDPLSRNEQSD